MSDKLRKLATKRSQSGHIGVFWVEPKQRWKAKITVNGKPIFLGYFRKLETAIKARIEAEIEHDVFQKPKIEIHGQWFEDKLIGKKILCSLFFKPKNKNVITQDELKKILFYNEQTGEFIWLVDVSAKTKAGSVAGRIDTKGYISIRIFNKHYLAHRLAWLYEYGKFPNLDLDHKNGIKTDNRIENLRECTHAENKQNLNKPMSTNKLGVLGVSIEKRKRKNKTSERFLAQIMLDGKQIKLGRFKTIDEAKKAREMAEKKYFTFKYDSNI